MFFKSSAMLLFVGILSFAAADNLDEYDEDVLRTMIRSQVVCPTSYSEYMQNCSVAFDHGIKKCHADEEQAKLVLKDESWDQRKKFVSQTDNSCKTIDECDNDNDDVAEIFGCLSQQGAKSAVAMNNLYYESNKLQNEYSKKIANIEDNKNACTNATTWNLSERNAGAIDELNKCFRTGKWELNLSVPEQPADSK